MHQRKKLTNWTLKLRTPLKDIVKEQISKPEGVIYKSYIDKGLASRIKKLSKLNNKKTQFNKT